MGHTETRRPRPFPPELVEALRPYHGQVFGGPGDWLTVAAFAEELGVHHNTVYAAVESGDIPAVRVGRSIRIPRRCLDVALDRADQLAIEAGAGRDDG